MALRGNLRDFSLTQILNLVNLAHKTGMLTIESPGETARVYFREGKLAYTHLGTDCVGLPVILHQAKKITGSQFQSILQHGSHISDKELGLMLIHAGYLTKEDIFSSLQQYFSEIIHRVFTWAEGTFQFENDLPTPANRINMRLDLENLILEGSRQMREWEELQDEIPSLAMALKFTDKPGTNLKKIQLGVEEWRVVSFVNPINTLQQIAEKLKMNDLEIRRIVFGLLQAGLVELVRPIGEPVSKVARIMPIENKEEKRSLVNRLINRIRSL